MVPATSLRHGLDSALDDACRVFDEDHRLAEALDATARGDAYFCDQYGEIFSAHETAMAFHRVAQMASDDCQYFGEFAVAEKCAAIAAFVRLAIDGRACDCIALMGHLPRIRSEGISAIDAASDLYAI